MMRLESCEMLGHVINILAVIGCPVWPVQW